jgi:hypothetical protein
MQLILHVGLPKTATTTIQHVMDSHKAALAAAGVLYPRTTKTQMELIRRTQFAQLAVQPGPGSLAEAMGWVAEEAREALPKRIVLSCERMALVSAGAVARMQAAITTWLPEVRDVRILAYVRDPVSWATSLCQQRLKMGTARRADFANDPWPLSLEAMLSNYVDRYGREAVSLRYLHPGHLVNGVVVDDFLAAIGLTEFALPGAAPVLNRALTLYGAQVAEVLADLLPRGQRKGVRKQLVRRLLQGIDGPRFVLPRAVQAGIVEASRGDVEYVRRQWGLEIGSTLVELPDAPELDAPELDEQAVLKLALALVAEVERVVAVEEGLQEEDADGS